MKHLVALNEIDPFAHTFWQLAGNAKVFAFHGEMGAGKTTLISALCRARGVLDAIGSPTFSIINEYADSEGQPIFHLDLYRLKDPEEVVQTGVEDTVGSGHTCMVEWPERAPELFDEQTVHVYLTVTEGGRREVEVRKAAGNPVQ